MSGAISLFTDIADAIREKDGTSEPISALDFPERILAISGGGEPDPPQDGKTRIYLNVPEGYRQDLKLAFQQTVSNGVLVDLGDGREPFTLSGTGTVSIDFSYQTPGKYVITFEVLSGELILQNYDYEWYDYINIIQHSRIGFYTNNGLIYKVIIGEGVSTIGAYVFAFYDYLNPCIICDGVTSIGNYAFQNCYSLQSITIPDGVTSIGDYVFGYCYSLQSITIPDGVTSIGDYAFYNCYSLQSITIPDGVTSIGDYAFGYCYSLQSITIPGNVTSIGGSAFQQCSSLQSLTIPDGVTSIGNNAFNNCTFMQEYIFLPTIPPVLSSTSVFYLIPSDCKIFVPDESVEAYKTATNWATYADYIYPLSERVTP